MINFREVNRIWLVEGDSPIHPFASINGKIWKNDPKCVGEFISVKKYDKLVELAKELMFEAGMVGYMRDINDMESSINKLSNFLEDKGE